MSEPQTKIYFVIVRQKANTKLNITALLQVLAVDYGLDIYTTRQRLIGAGMAVIAQGGLTKVNPVATLLRSHGFACWLIEPRKPLLVPDLLRSLAISDSQLDLTCQKDKVILERGVHAVGVLADLSGGLLDKHVHRLLAQDKYRGREALEILSRDEMIKIILQGQPVFDFYLLDESGQVQHAVQVIPGRFNAAGLGSLATLSSKQNLLAMIKIVEEYAGVFRLHCDFGLGHVPGCFIQSSSKQPANAADNLASLNQYGWLMTQLRGDGFNDVKLPSGESCAVPSFLNSAAVAHQGLDLCSSHGKEPSGQLDPDKLNQKPEEANIEIPGSGPTDNDFKSVTKDLPPPPDRPSGQFKWQKPVLTMGVFTLAVALGFGSQNQGLVDRLARHEVTTIFLPGLFAAILFWGGFRCIGLKRQIENTPTSKIRSMATGLVEIHGRACRIYALVAPMSHSACVWYRLRKYRKDSKNKWKLVKQHDSNHVPFEINDGSGRVLIDPQGASIKAQVQQTGYPGNPYGSGASFFSDNGSDEKWVEDIIHEGSSLYILGFARPMRKQQVSLRDRVRAKLRQVKLDQEAMRHYDINADGRVDGEEWQVAQKDAEQHALHESLTENLKRKRQEEHLMIGKAPHRNMPFIVAEAVSEAHVSRKYGWLSLLLLLGGVLTTIFALNNLLRWINA